jgi:hypothetical protein
MRSVNLVAATSLAGAVEMVAALNMTRLRAFGRFWDDVVIGVLRASPWGP